MFKGTIPVEVRAMLLEAANAWDVEALAVACSGNFTIERVFHGRYPTLMGCDVTAYTCALGAWFARQPFRVAIKPEHESEWGWLAEGMHDQAGATATIMLFSSLSDSLDKHLHVKPNAYYQRLVDGYRRRWPEMLDRTRERLEQQPLRLASFNIGDAVDWLPTLGPDVAVCSFPPFFAKGYAVMFERLDTLLVWDAPAYQEIFDERRDKFLHDLMNRRCWAVGTSYPLPDLEPYLRGRSQTTNRGVPLYVYMSKGHTRVVAPSQKTEPVSNPRLVPGDEVGERLWLAQLTGGQFNALRSQYLNENIKPGDPNPAIAVMVDDRVIGALGFLKGYKVPNASADTAYLLSDFAVAPSDYTRLSKLVLIAALSKEARLLAERAWRSRIRSIVTTAFSRNPVSMKYRGLFELTSRKETPNDPHHAYQLQYAALAGQWTLDEGLSLWKRKHASKHAPSTSTLPISSSST